MDVWSIGCIMYTLLCGQPPFETKTLKETYTRIKKCDYILPDSLRRPEAEMIIAMLKSDPARRPTVATLLQATFMLSGHIPEFLPQSCLTMAPRGDHVDEVNDRRPLAQLNADIGKLIGYRILWGAIKFIACVICTSNCMSDNTRD